MSNGVLEFFTARALTPAEAEWTGRTDDFRDAMKPDRERG